MVRATFAGFSTALSAIQASQKRLDITGQNLANMNTAGYTRQQLQVSSLNYTNPISHYMNGSEISVGFGVHMDKVTQVRDPYLDMQYRNQMYRSGYTDSMQTSLDQLSEFLDETSIEGIRQAFDNVQSSLENMSDPSHVVNPIYESELRSRMQALTNLLNEASRKLDEAEQAEYSKLSGKGTSENGSVEQINDMLRQIGDLNRQIKRNQIHGQPSLELMDERNMLLDQLASYIPIEVTYYKDVNHDGIDNTDPTKPDLSEEYHLDGQGNILGKKEWPDDVRVEMVYESVDPNTGLKEKKKIVLVEGSYGNGEIDKENYGKLSIDATPNPDGSVSPENIKLTFTAAHFDKDGKENANPTTVDFNKNAAAGGTQFPSDSGSIQASLDMLWKDGATANLDDVKGYDYYRDQLDTLARNFAIVMNEINIHGTSTDPNVPKDDTQFLLFNRDTGTYTDGLDITAGNIGISSGWIGGTVTVSKVGTDEDGGKNSNGTVLNLLEAMKTKYGLDANGDPINSVQDILKGLKDANGKPIEINLGNNSFADYMNHASTVLANDSYHNQVALKTNVTVLNGIQNSRDSVSGVSLNEEASNTMIYMSAYNAASRLMTALDEALNTLINNTGLVGR
ncbi:flagellar biosynthesis protein FlgK [bacterium 1XD42-94]|nr:flagellar biosynthesis protein FlgK [bacterium 1XD42-76]NBK03961.1 flagellar biosynthesis protein FlgK [bacterium 1XD42-94]